MQFELTILGSNGAVPAYDRHPTSQILNYNGNLFLIDCGEGTQFQMSKFSIKRGRLDNIFISHLHGDHFYGLIGLLTSFNLNWREHPLNIYGPEGLEEIIHLQLKLSLTEMRYKIHFHTLLAKKPEIIFDDEALTVETIILKHRIPTTGFLFREKKNLRKIIPEKITRYHIPHHKILEIKKGEDYLDANGNRVPNSELTLDPPHPRSYAFCSDTAYIESFVEQIKGVNILYHETTFTEEDSARAEETFHSTAKQAAKVAKLSNAGKLLIGHFSARYENLEVVLNESKEIFPETYLAEEGKVFPI